MLNKFCDNNIYSYTIIYVFYYFCFEIIFYLSDILIGFKIIYCFIIVFFIQLVYVQITSPETDSILQVYLT